MAEMWGFEPQHGQNPPTGFRIRTLQPLGYISKAQRQLYHIFRHVSTYFFVFFKKFSRNFRREILYWKQAAECDAFPVFRQRKTRCTSPKLSENSFPLCTFFFEKKVRKKAIRTFLPKSPCCSRRNISATSALPKQRREYSSNLEVLLIVRVFVICGNGGKQEAFSFSL